MGYSNVDMKFLLFNLLDILYYNGNVIEKKFLMDLCKNLINFHKSSKFLLSLIFI